MATSKRGRPRSAPSFTEKVPPGATRAAFDRPEEPGGSPGSGAGPRHAAGDEGDENESLGHEEVYRFAGDPPMLDEVDPLEQGPPYAGPTGGAVGGTPAEGRSKGGRIHRS